MMIGFAQFLLLTMVTGLTEELPKQASLTTVRPGATNNTALIGGR